MLIQCDAKTCFLLIILDDMKNQTLKNRLKTIRDRLALLKADCLIVTKPANVTYVTGFTGDDTWALILPKTVYLVTDSRYIEQAANECLLCKIVERKNAMVKTVAAILHSQRKIRLTAIENSIPVADFEELKKRFNGRIKSANRLVESARRTKDDNEIAAIKTAAILAGRAFERTCRQIRPGLTENQLAGILDFEFRRAGGRNSFDTIVAFGSNASRPHHQPTDRKLRKNDTVLIDFGVRHNSYCCDITRCFPVGKPSILFNKVYAAVNEARSAALALVRAGAEIKQIDAAAKAAIQKFNLPPYGHGTGHGLGLEVHELPAVSAVTKGGLQAGDVITIEPAVYIPRKLGVRIEDDILVTENGYALLTGTCYHKGRG